MSQAKYPAPARNSKTCEEFRKDAATGEILHTFSSYGRGLDILLGTYNLLDFMPKGRDEEGLAFSMSWVRHHDKYTEGYFVDPTHGYVAPKSADGGCCSGEKQP